MVRVGLIGVGFMGWIHYLAYRQASGAKLTAISTRDPQRLAGDWRGIKGNFGPPGEMVDLSGVACYADWKALLADPNVDVVDICLPPYLHAEVAIAAAQAGKHVFCEKPLALQAEECQQMVQAVAAAKKQLLTGHVLPFLPEYAVARELQAGGKYGKLLGGHFRRVISDPQWLPDFYNAHRVGGPLLDLHVHDAHFIRLLFGMPTAVSSVGRLRHETVSYCETQFEFADPSLVVSATSGVIGQQGRPFLHGFEIHWEQATLSFEFAVLGEGQPAQSQPLTLFTADGKVSHPSLPSGDPMLAAFTAEIAEVVACLEQNRPSALLGGDLARDAIELCHLQSASVKQRAKQQV